MGSKLVVSGQWEVGKDVLGPDWAGFAGGCGSCMEWSLIGHHAFPTSRSRLTTSGTVAP
jgi:hypothetical protein